MVTFSVLMILIHEGIAMITIAYMIFIFKKKILSLKFDTNLLSDYSPYFYQLIVSGNVSASNLIWSR